MSIIAFEVEECSNKECKAKFINEIDVGDSDFKTLILTCPFCGTQSQKVFEKDSIEIISKSLKE